MEIEYLSGRVTGFWGREWMSLGELSLRSDIGIADKIQVPILDDVKWDGILGLGFANSQMKSKNVLPLMDQII